MLHVDIACILSGMAKISFLFFLVIFMVLMYHMGMPRFQSVCPVCIPKAKSVYPAPVSCSCYALSPPLVQFGLGLLNQRLLHWPCGVHREE